MNSISTKNLSVKTFRVVIFFHLSVVRVIGRVYGEVKFEEINITIICRREITCLFTDV